MSKRDEIKQMIREALKKELIKNAKQQRITEAAKDFYDSVQLVKELKRSGSSKLPKAMSLAKIAQERLHESIEDDVAAVISIVEPSDEGMVVDNSPVYDSLLSAIASAKKLYMNINIDTEVNDWVIQQVIDAERSLRAACEYFNQQEAHTAAVEDREATVDYIGDGEYEDGGVMEESKQSLNEDVFSFSAIAIYIVIWLAGVIKASGGTEIGKAAKSYAEREAYSTMGKVGEWASTIGKLFTAKGRKTIKQWYDTDTKIRSIIDKVMAKTKTDPKFKEMVLGRKSGWVKATKDILTPEEAAYVTEKFKNRIHATVSVRTNTFGEDIRPLLRTNLNEAGMMIRGAAAASAAMYVASKGRSTGGVQQAIDASIEDDESFYARMDKKAFESTYTEDMLKKAGYDVSGSKIKITADTGDREKTNAFLKPFQQFFGMQIKDWFQAIKGSGNNSLISIGPGSFSGVSIFVVDKNGDKFRAAKKFKTGDAGEKQALEYLKSDEFKKLIQYKDSGSDSNIF